ncbi:MAG TPA: GntR family transcriptional regulator [Verrucomicrobiae bacterium]
MLFHIDSDSATPVYHQLVDQVQHGAASGVLKPGDSLPPIRSLAEQLRLNRNTVAKAYGELEHLGVLKLTPGKGSFIKPAGSSMTPKNRREILAAKIDAALIAAHQLQIDPAEFSELVKDRIALLSLKTPKTSAVPPKKTPPPSLNESEGWSPGVD